MNDLLSDTKSVLLFLLGALMAVFTWIGKLGWRRIEHLEATSVTREELARTIALMREDRLQMHLENREELRYIRQRVDGIADRQ